MDFVDTGSHDLTHMLNIKSSLCPTLDMWGIFLVKIFQLIATNVHIAIYYLIVLYKLIGCCAYGGVKAKYYKSLSLLLGHQNAERLMLCFLICRDIIDSNISNLNHPHQNELQVHWGTECSIDCRSVNLNVINLMSLFALIWFKLIWIRIFITKSDRILALALV